MNDGILNWNIDPEIFSVLGFPIRYYGLSWALGIAMAYVVIKRVYNKENIAPEKLDKLLTYLILGIFLGARLGHCLFYQPEYYIHNPIEIFIPITKFGDSYKFVGFQGLASHGGAIGVIMAIGVYCKNYKTSFLWVLDRIALVAPITGAFIRIGNFMNSEIYGKPTNGNWGVIFERDDLIPRHPTQLYEAFSYILIFIILIYLYKRKNHAKQNGLIFGVCLVLIFLARFIIEFFKENQVGFENEMSINMGQTLSIPFIAIGLFIIFKRKKSSVGQWL